MKSSSHQVSEVLNEIEDITVCNFLTDLNVLVIYLEVEGIGMVEIEKRDWLKKEETTAFIGYKDDRLLQKQSVGSFI